ncbi:MAG: nitroreductase family protein, partial [Desulfomonilaceae bacterium]
MIKPKLAQALCFTLTTILLAVSLAQATDEFKTIQLPKPEITHGKPLMQTLSERKTSREFDAKEIDRQTLSNLLWAAFGINRPDGRRTAPSAHNHQEIDIFVAMKTGLYRYDPKGNALIPVVSDDLRAKTGLQGYVKEAPLDLVYVADFAKMTNCQESEKSFLSAADTGFIGQNVYLYSSSEGLATVIRGNIDKKKLSEAMKLRPDQIITLAQCVGYPKVKASGDGTS